MNYSRQAIYVKDAFWIVKDNFNSDTTHDYKQVWQGHYTSELGPDLIRSSFSDASGCDIFQLNQVDSSVNSGARGKNWSVITKENKKSFDFLTVIFPYNGYNNRIDETKKQVKLDGWLVNDSKWIANSNATIISKKNKFFFFGIKEAKQNDLTIQVSKETDLYVSVKNNTLNVHLLGDDKVSITVKQGNNIGFTEMLKPGDQHFFTLD